MDLYFTKFHASHRLFAMFLGVLLLVIFCTFELSGFGSLEKFFLAGFVVKFSLVSAWILILRQVLPAGVAAARGRLTFFVGLRGLLVVFAKFVLPFGAIFWLRQFEQSRFDWLLFAAGALLCLICFVAIAVLDHRYMWREIPQKPV